MIKSSERRQEIRERVTTPVLYRLDDRTLLQNSYDISQGGISVMCPYLPGIGAPINLRFTHPRQGVYIQADGQVVHVFPTTPPNGANRIGVKFTNISRPTLSDIFSS